MKTSPSTSQQDTVVIEPLNKKGLARLLGVSVYILKRMLDDSHADMGKPIGTVYCQKQVQYMVNKYGIMK